jgi:hypothetical protein
MLVAVVCGRQEETDVGKFPMAFAKSVKAEFGEVSSSKTSFTAHMNHRPTLGG